MLLKLPPVSIVGGSVDPLSDDSVQFVHRMCRLGKRDVRLRIVESLPHGFLHMAGVSPDAKSAMLQLGRWIAEYLDVPFEQRRSGDPTPPNVQTFDETDLE